MALDAPFAGPAPGPDLLPAVSTLGGLALLPIALVMWLRLIALRSSAADPTTVWFGFARRVQWIHTAWWVAWVASVFTLQAAGIAFRALGSPNLWLLFGVTLAIYLVPPALVSVGIASLAHAVAARIRGSSQTLREAVLQSVWKQAALIGPLMLLLLAFPAFLLHQGRVGVVLCVAALTLRIALASRLLTTSGLAPHSVTSGELRDRVFELAKKAGVRLRQLYVIPMARLRTANAFAVQGGTVMLSDYLLEHLTRREVDAVVAHELAHLRLGHPRRLALVLALGCAATVVALPMSGGSAAAWTAGAAGTIVLFNFVSRRFERAADAAAVRISEDPEAAITAFVKLGRLNHMPLDWGRWDERFLTHPSTLRRVRAVAAAGGLPDRRVDELLHADPAADDHYALAPAATGKVFSTAFKLRKGVAVALWVQGVSVLAPALVIGLARWSGWIGWSAATRWAVDLVALAAGLVASLAAINVLAVRPYRELGRRLRARLIEQGLDADAGGGFFVGLAPHSPPRVYEGFHDWDAGFLFFERERLCYVGEEIRFALWRSQVRQVRVVPGTPGWIPTARVELRWEDHVRATEGVLSLRPADARALSRLIRGSTKLAKRLEAWREGALRARAEGRVPRDLDSPRIGSVTSLSSREVAAPRTLVLGVALCMLMAAGACILLGLEFHPSRSPGFLDLTLAGWLIVVFHRVPYWRTREPEQEGPAVERAKAA